MNWKDRKTRQDFYKSQEWQILRNYILSTKPLCELCINRDRITPATEVHHIIDIQDDPTKRLDMKNLQPLCVHCHNKLSAANRINNENDFVPVKKVWEVKSIELKKPKI